MVPTPLVSLLPPGSRHSQVNPMPRVRFCLEIWGSDTSAAWTPCDLVTTQSNSPPRPEELDRGSQLSLLEPGPDSGLWPQLPPLCCRAHTGLLMRKRTISPVGNLTWPRSSPQKRQTALWDSIAMTDRGGSHAQSRHDSCLTDREALSLPAP